MASSTIETTAQITSQIGDTVRVMADDVVKTIEDTIAKSADIAYTAMKTKLITDIRAQVESAVCAQLKGQTMFSPHEPVCALPALTGATYLRDEYVAVCRDTHYITNYGRYLWNNEQCWSPGYQLSDDVTGYIHAILHGRRSTRTHSKDVRWILKTYNAKFAMATNTVHDDKIKEIRAAIIAEFADERRELDGIRAELEDTRAANLVSASLNATQAALLETDRAELDERIRKSKAHQRAYSDLKIATKQVDLIKARLAQQASRLHNQEIILQQKHAQLKALKSELSEREAVLGLNINDLVSDDECESYEDSE